MDTREYFGLESDIWGCISPVSLTCWVASSKSLPSSRQHIPSIVLVVHCMFYLLKRAGLREANPLVYQLSTPA